MDTVGECSSKKGTRRQNTGKRPVRKRSSRNRKQTSVSQLIQQLRETVFPDPDAQATRHQVLQTAKLYIQQLENTLDSLLKMRGRCQTEDSGCCSLEDIKEEYLQLYHIDQGYLHFYTQTVDVLVENSVVSPEQVTHPVVSKAIFSLWQDLSQEGKANIYQYGIPQASSTPCSLTYPSGTGCTIRDSGAESQEATSSFLSSTPEEVLYDDAFDVVSDFLAQNTDQMMHSPRSPPHGSSPLESLEGYSHLYQQITGFLRTRLSSYTQASVLQCDYETVLLRCTETFEDEDDL
ncbi:stimulated by retinoic acid gene 8 protein homolog isoform X2 [Pseudophryne corroboree]|uniref:stimulated by retinoic acid gene 8 protein homolog isoform X2 n=1 Tax=Pseudophryne corroboree TaxID=495146 RepID=UPI0030812157